MQYLETGSNRSEIIGSPRITVVKRPGSQSRLMVSRPDLRLSRGRAVYYEKLHRTMEKVKRLNTGKSGKWEETSQGKHCVRKETFPEPSTCTKLIFLVFLNYIHKYLYYSTALVFSGNSSCMLDFLIKERTCHSSHTTQNFSVLIPVIMDSNGRRKIHKTW